MKLAAEKPVSLHRATLVAIALVGLMYCVTLAGLPVDSFWVTDNENKYLQMESILKQNYTDYSILWLGQDTDPDFVYQPMPGLFSKVRDGKLYSIFSPVFATISTLPYRVFGHAGLFLIPLIAALAALMGVSRVAGGVGPAWTVPVAVFLAGASSPVWFYAVTFWEHTLALAFAVWSTRFMLRFVRLARRPDLIRSMALGAAAIYLRDEMYVFVAALMITVVWHNSRAWFSNLAVMGATVGATLVPLWVFQNWAIGEPFGFHVGEHVLAGTDVVGHLRQRYEVVYNLLIASSASSLVSWLCAAPFVVLALWRPWVDRAKWILPAVSIVVFVVSVLVLAGQLTADSRLEWLLQSNGLFAAAPFLALALVRTDSSNSVRTVALRRLLAVYVLLHVLASPVIGSRGIHWGCRFLLVVYPLAAVLAARNLGAWVNAYGRGWPAATLVLPLLMSLAMQGYSVHLLSAKKEYSHELNLAIEDRTEDVVISGVWWGPHALHSVFFDRPVFYLRPDRTIDQLSAKIYSHRGPSTFTLVAQPTSPDPSLPRISDGRLNFFWLQMFGGDFGQDE